MQNHIQPRRYHFAFTDGHPRDEAHNSLYYLRYDGGQFFKADGSLVGNIRSLPILHGRSDVVYPSRLYVSRQINGLFEIEKWSSPDKGETWLSRSITTNSKHNNVRPIVPRGYLGSKDYVLWMFGAYEHFTKFRTGIKLLHLRD